MRSSVGREKTQRGGNITRKVGVKKSLVKAPTTPSIISSSRPLSSFIEHKKQQLSLLFIAWDKDDVGRIESWQIRPIINALFPSDGKTEVLRRNEIREAFAEAVKQSWSPQYLVTLGEVYAIMDALWSSQERRTRMVMACLRSVFNVVSDARLVISREALLEFGKSVAGADVSAGVVQLILTAASETPFSDTINFEGFCRLLLPRLVHG
ncbi:hypothetical protein, conserved [Trypanosoma cruzi]|uniref:Uncharacterized protein n=1 Tax=Trypanosoma cruzi (strain CL Brener) TaxID=353153 RepID=Q4DH03_TRYCC|nr:hypothetical protein, conserved [Trypanosoma cruzi]EAN91799.1 hypothetical protein, conserved [Trypanosoma cruzi]|eukprot:XP_813650.1 hypothetical protein [Trypanosoma cruzi strain CL Brener]